MASDRRTPRRRVDPPDEVDLAIVRIFGQRTYEKLCFLRWLYQTQRDKVT